MYGDDDGSPDDYTQDHYTYSDSNDATDCQERRPGGYWYANYAFEGKSPGMDLNDCGGLCCAYDGSGNCLKDTSYGSASSYPFGSGRGAPWTTEVATAQINYCKYQGFSGCACLCYGKQEGDVVWYPPPAPPLPPPPDPPAPPPRPPAVPHGSGTSCAELKRRWDLGIAKANAALTTNSRQDLHDYAFSRQCWQYTLTTGNSNSDPEHECTNSIEQFGFKGNWWSGDYGDPGSFGYTGDPDPTGTGGLNLQLQPAAIFGHYRLCKWNADTLPTGCSPGDAIYLDKLHPSYRYPRGYVHPLTAQTSGHGYCDPSGVYAPTLTFPATATTDSEGADGGDDTGLGRITPADPPPPAAPPSPPTPPAPHSYTLQALVYQPSPTAPACAQTLQMPEAPFDVLSGQECADAITELGATNYVDPVMTGNYSDGFRCFVNTTNAFVWNVVATGSPSGAYVCRYP